MSYSNVKTKKLGEILKLEYGKSLPKADRKSDGKFFVYGANGVKARSDKFYYGKPSVIVGRKGSAGEVNLTEGKFWPLDVTYFVTFDKKRYDLMFLFYLLNTLDLPGLAKGVKPGINRNDVYDIEVIDLSFSEQKRIVKILDEVFEKIGKAKENARKNLENSREVFESVLEEIFSNPGEGWEEKELGRLGEITSSKRIFKKEYKKKGIPFYRTKEIKELANNRKITTELFISKNRYNEIKEKFGVPQKGDLLVSAIGTIGEIYVVKDEDVFYFKDGNVLWLKSFKSVDSNFLKYALRNFVEKLKRLSHGSAYNALPIQKLKKYAIAIPSLTKQKQIVKKLDALAGETKKLEENYQKRLDDLEELKKSVLESAFAGKL